MTSSNRIFGDSYVPKYSQDHYTLPWYERGLVTYIDWLRYNEMSDNPDKYFDKKVVINFDIIHHECRGDSSKNNIKNINLLKNQILMNTQRMKKRKLFLL